MIIMPPAGSSKRAYHAPASDPYAKRRATISATKTASTESPGSTRNSRSARSIRATADNGAVSHARRNLNPPQKQAQRGGGSTCEDESEESYSILLPTARGAGDIPYQDDRLHPNTFLFLKDLKANNNRNWLKCKPTLLASLAFP